MIVQLEVAKVYEISKAADSTSQPRQLESSSLPSMILFPQQLFPYHSAPFRAQNM